MSKSLLIYLLCNIISKAATFLLLPFLLLYLTVNDFGIIESVLLIVNLVSPFSFLLIDSWLEKNNFLLFKEIQFQRVVNTIFLIGFLVSGVSIIFFYLLEGRTHILIFGISILTLPFSNVLRIKLLKVRYDNELRTFLYISIFQAILLVLSSLFLFYNFTEYLLMFFLSQFITSVAANLFCNYRLNKKIFYFNFKSIQLGLLFKSLKFTFPLIPSNYINILISNSHRYLSLLFYSVENLGVIGLMARFSTPINLLGDSYLNYLSPLVFRDTSSSKKELKSALKLFSFGFPILLLGYYVFIKLLIIFGFLKLENNVLYLLIFLLCGVYVGLIIKLDYLVFIKFEKTKHVFYSNVLYVSLLLIFSLFIKVGFVDFETMIRMSLLLTCLMVILIYVIGNRFLKIPLMLNLRNRMVVVIGTTIIVCCV